MKVRFMIFVFLLGTVVSMHVQAGGPPLVYPSTNNSNTMTTQETLEVKGQLKLSNVGIGTEPQFITDVTEHRFA